MDLNKKYRLKEYFFFYLAGLLLLLLLKLFYSRANASQLLLLLAPVSYLVSLFTGIPFYLESQAGFVNHTLRFIIAPSCSGMQFMMITFATLFFSFLHHMETKKKGFCWFAVSLTFSYLFTIPVNTLRIILSLYLPDFLQRTILKEKYLNQDTLHTMIGTVTYFASLLILYQLTAHSFSRRSQKDPSSGFTIMQSLSPIFWYLALVLGVPFMTRILQKDFYGFSAYAFLILTICTGVVCLFFLVRFVTFSHKRFR